MKKIWKFIRQNSFHILPTLQSSAQNPTLYIGFIQMQGQSVQNFQCSNVIESVHIPKYAFMSKEEFVHHLNAHC
jgi:hypothetical protein